MKILAVIFPLCSVDVIAAVAVHRASVEAESGSCFCSSKAILSINWKGCSLLLVEFEYSHEHQPETMAAAF
jgi:hypothetical protein